ncbi:hypothetical protein [Arenimonas sp. MALMAid1274]|uniref:hypothetical protein n=1 Tax=Arenimonas sp. MALMAid1274 TaxID=3411630 RepID=UPI003B9F8394
MSHAHELITAVQSCQPARLRAVIAQLQRLADANVKHLRGSERHWQRKTYLDDRLPGPLDLTALHVAAKGYAAHADDPTLAQVFDTMVQDLLEAGASPWLEVGAKQLCGGLEGKALMTFAAGKTVAEVCDGRMPPSLSAWFAARVSENHVGRSLHATTKQRTEERLKAWRECKRLRDEAKAALQCEAAMERRTNLALAG